MFSKYRSCLPAFLRILVAMGCMGSEEMAQTARQLVTHVIDERQTVELPDNTRPEANAEYDRIRVDDALVLDHVQLLLKRPPEREAALAQFIDLVDNPKSSSLHQWVMVKQFRADFGPADADVSAVTGWLSSHGLTVNDVKASGMVIDFSGAAGQIRDAFKTEIHRLDVGGVAHVANMSNPQIPAALADVVDGIMPLNDSFAAPVCAGFQALVDQKTGARQGNPDTIYYTLAAMEFTAGERTTCNSSRGNGVASGGIFCSITLGDMDVNCSGTSSGYRPSGTYGVLSTSDSSYSKAYDTGIGWNFATGIGTVNVTHLVVERPL